MNDPPKSPPKIIRWTLITPLQTYNPEEPAINDEALSPDDPPIVPPNEEELNELDWLLRALIEQE